MRKIVVNDANILIDMVQLELMHSCCQLSELVFVTTDFVFDELYDSQKVVLQPFVQNGLLGILTSSFEDLAGIYALLEYANKLSIPDCSIWYFAKKYDAILLTGDGLLRKHSRSNGIEVRGSVFLLDQLLLAGLLTFDVAMHKIEALYALNARLPIAVKEQRLHCWKHKEHCL